MGGKTSQHDSALTVPKRKKEPSENYDFTVKIKDKKFRFQKEILKQHSEYFKVLFESDFCEKDKDEIELFEVPSLAAMEVIVAYMEGTRFSLTPDTVSEVIIGADFLQITDGMAKLKSLLYESITTETWYKYLETAATINDTFQELLRGVVYEWMRDHFSQIWSSPAFSELPKALQDEIEYGPYKGTETYAICCIDFVQYGDEPHATQQTRFPCCLRSRKSESKSEIKGEFELQNVRLNIWHQSSSSWETITSTPPDILTNLSTIPAVFSVSDLVILLNADNDGIQHSNGYYYSLDEYYARLYSLRDDHRSQERIATMYLDIMYCYNIRKDVWEVVHPATPTKSVQFIPSLLYPVEVGHKLHLIIQGKASTPGQHLCFDPVKCEWCNLEPAPLPYLEKEENHWEGSAVIGAVSNGTHILVLSFHFYPGDEMFEMNRCIFYSLFDVTKETWTSPKRLVTNDTGPNLFLMSSKDDKIKIVHLVRPIFDNCDTLIIDCHDETVTSVNSHTQHQSKYDWRNKPFYNNDTTVSIGGKTYGCAIRPYEPHRVSKKDRNPRLYDPHTDTIVPLPNPPTPSTSAESKCDSAASSRHVQLAENDPQLKQSVHIMKQTRVSLKLVCPTNT